MADPANADLLRLGMGQQRDRNPRGRTRTQAYYSAKDVPHGQVSQRWYYSKVTGKWRRSYVYTPPEYDANPKTRLSGSLPACIGWGENEEGWHNAGPRGPDHG